MYTTETRSNFNNNTNIKKFYTILFKSVITFWTSLIFRVKMQIFIHPQL